MSWASNGKYIYMLIIEEHTIKMVYNPNALYKCKWFYNFTEKQCHWYHYITVHYKLYCTMYVVYTIQNLHNYIHTTKSSNDAKSNIIHFTIITEIRAKWLPPVHLRCRKVRGPHHEKKQLKIMLMHYYSHKSWSALNFTNFEKDGYHHNEWSKKLQRKAEV